MSNAPLIIDSADKTPPIPAHPPHQMVNGAMWRDRPRARLDWPWHVSAALAVVLLLFGGFLVYRIDAALRTWSESSPLAAWLSAFAPVALVGVGLCVFLYWLTGKAYYSIARSRAQAYQELLTRTRLGVPVAADVAASIDVQTMFLAEQSAIALEISRAPYTKYPLLSTLSEGNHEEATTTINGVGEEAQPPAIDPQAGPMLDQLRKRYAKSAEHLFVGTVGETPVHLRWGAAGLSAIAGGSGGGKTNTTRLIAAWHALNGGGLALCDGHGEVDEGLIASCAALAPAYVLPPAVKDADIAATIRRMDAIGRARINGLEPKDIPLLLIIDEFTSLCRNHADAARLINLLLNFGDEYRKVNLQCLIIGHHWRGDLIDKQLGAALRAAIGERIVHNTAPEEARFLLKPAELQGVDRLRPGEALFFGRAADVQKIVVPWLPAEALGEVRYPAHPGWPLSVETPGTTAQDRRKAEVKAKIARLAPEQRLGELRKALALRGNTRTGWRYTTDYLREMFAIDQRIVIALSQEVRGGKTNGVSVE